MTKKTTDFLTTLIILFVIYFFYHKYINYYFNKYVKETLVRKTKVYIKIYKTKFIKFINAKAR